MSGGAVEKGYNRQCSMVRVGSISIPVVSIDDLIKLKKISGRQQDMEDIRALKKVKLHEKKKK